MIILSCYEHLLVNCQVENKSYAEELGLYLYICAEIVIEGAQKVPFFYLIILNKVVEHKIAEVLELLFKEEDYNDCFLVEIKESPDRSKLEVFIESDSTLTLGKCQKISRYLEKHIEEKRWLPEKYLLEVSSPGVGNPLVLKRQYLKNIGRMIEVQLNDGAQKKGNLTEVTEDQIIVVKAAKGKGKKKQEEKVYNIDFNQIKMAIIKVSF